MAWKKLSSKQIYKSHWMEVTEDQVAIDSGKEITFGVVHKKPFALIIPWDGKRLTLVGQYRYAADVFSWEFPQGHLEHDDVYKTAQKELEEETGLNANKIVEIGTFYLAPGHHSQICHVFFATELSERVAAREETEEDMQVKQVILSDFEELIAKGEIKDGPTLAAFLMLKEKKFL